MKIKTFFIRKSLFAKKCWHCKKPVRVLKIPKFQEKSHIFMKCRWVIKELQNKIYSPRSLRVEAVPFWHSSVYFVQKCIIDTMHNSWMHPAIIRTNLIDKMNTSKTKILHHCNTCYVNIKKKKESDIPIYSQTYV